MDSRPMLLCSSNDVIHHPLTSHYQIYTGLSILDSPKDSRSENDNGNVCRNRKKFNIPGGLSPKAKTPAANTKDKNIYSLNPLSSSK
jgi:hypothetical protein